MRSPLVHSGGDDPDRPRLRAASNGRARSRRQRPTTRTTPSQPTPTGARRREHSDNAPRSSPRSTPLRPPVHCWPSSHDRKSPRRQRSTLKTDKTEHGNVVRCRVFSISSHQNRGASRPAGLLRNVAACLTSLRSSSAATMRPPGRRGWPPTTGCLLGAGRQEAWVLRRARSTRFSLRVSVR